MTEFKAACPYCNTYYKHENKQTVKRARYEHIRDEHGDEKSLDWQKDTPSVKRV